MKRLLIALLFLIPMISFAQNVTFSKNEIKDLKEVTGMYSHIMVQATFGKLIVAVETNLEGGSRFVDGNGKEMKFNTITEVLNFMYKNGWVFKQVIRNEPAFLNYYFERKV